MYVRTTRRPSAPRWAQRPPLHGYLPLHAITGGQRNRGIAEMLNISVRTVDRHSSNLYAKLGVAGRARPSPMRFAITDQFTH